MRDFVLRFFVRFVARLSDADFDLFFDDVMLYRNWFCRKSDDVVEECDV